MAYSQMDKPLRAEIVVSTETYPFALINLEKKGVLIHTAMGETNKTVAQSSVQNFLFYDIYLRQKFQINTNFPPEYAVVNHTLEGEKVHLILRNQIYRNTLTPTFLMNVDLLDGKFSIDTVFSLSKIPTLTGFLHDSRVWLVQVDRLECAVNTAKIGDSIIFKYDFPKFSSQEILDAALDTITQKLYVLYGDDLRRDDFLTLAAFDTSANLWFSKQILLNAENRPIQAKLAFDKHNKLFIYGTYNLASERQRIETTDRLTTSAGFFSMEIKDTLPTLLLMQNYADFDSVDANISIEQSQILRQKRGRRQQPFSLDLLMSFHVKTIDETSFVIGESLMRDYKTTTQTYYDYYGRVVPYTSTVFDGYRFNDAFIWILDSNGSVRKNYITDISMTLKAKTLITKTAYFTEENETFLMFANATNVFYKTVQPYEKSYQTLKLQPLHKGDKVVEDFDSRILNWYGSHFLVCGYQTIQNNNLKGSNKRIVFYLSKVSMD